MRKQGVVSYNRPLGLNAWVGHSRGMHDAHSHFDLELNYVLDGTMAYLIDGMTVTLPQHRLCVLWGAVPHRTLHTSTEIKAIWVTVSLTEVLGWNLAEWFIERLLHEGLIVDTEENAGDLPGLYRWIDDLNAKDASEEKRALMLMELQARLRRMALSVANRSSLRLQTLQENKGAGLGEEPDAVEILARFIAAHYRQDIAIEQIAAAAHLHPNYAMTLFRRRTGITINRYLILQRVAHAQRLLATTRRSVTDIAFESGFGSISRFYEAFQQEIGCSPQRFRRRRSGENQEARSPLHPAE